MHTSGPWYAKNAGNDSQGLVIAEATGKNIAVTYDKQDAALVAAAPEMLKALKLVRHWLESDVMRDDDQRKAAQAYVEYTIQEAEGGI